MNIRKLISITMLALAAAVSTPVYANSIAFGLDVLYSKPALNKNLESGEYDFASQHSRYGSSFKDTWKFTVATDSTVSISVFDNEVGFGKPGSAQSLKSRYPQRFSQRTSVRRFGNNPNNSVDTSKIFDTKNLTLSLYDYKNHLIGTTGENGTLSNLSLLAGKWYTIQVTGLVNGFYGSSYHGVLDNNVTPVPLGDTAPMLGSALILLALRLRKRPAIIA